MKDLPTKAAKKKGERDTGSGSGLDTLPGTRTRGLTQADGDGGALVDRIFLLVTAGPSAGKTFSSAGERVIVGTHEACDLRLEDQAVSRFHCELQPVDGKLQIRDLGSKNGTIVDGVAIVQAFLVSGATIKIGRSELRFDHGNDQIKVPISDRDRFGVMVGRSPAMRRAFALLERAAASDSTVLIEGETGTGKEAAAESIHRESPRARGPFITVDCGAIPPDLLESELFGHEKGAFTGAVAAREGAFQAAEGGTIFLDEIGELSGELQPKLLRALERKQVKRVGSNKYVPVDVRVVAATNRNLRGEVNAGRFRSDLYYRLAVLEVTLPPLRERADDLPPLVEHVLVTLGASERPGASALRSKEFMTSLARHAWPGNVRELRNYLERCLAFRDERLPSPGAMATGSSPTSTTVEVDVSQPLREAREAWLKPFERRYIEKLLEKHDHNITSAARAAGVDRITFYRILWRHGLK
jgi:transcriptional regulator with PAS, ATPase and Fis domain